MWIVVIILGVVWQAIGAFDGCSGVTDLGGNSATGNGVANCVNVSC